jgi:hypothetical protein
MGLFGHVNEGIKFKASGLKIRTVRLCRGGKRGGLVGCGGGDDEPDCDYDDPCVTVPKVTTPTATPPPTQTAAPPHAVKEAPPAAESKLAQS